jgi:hypothetical protein
MGSVEGTQAVCPVIQRIVRQQRYGDVLLPGQNSPWFVQWLTNRENQEMMFRTGAAGQCFRPRTSEKPAQLLQQRFEFRRLAQHRTYGSR